MNCLEFRKRLVTDPNNRDPSFQLHAQECPACAAQLRAQTGFEQALRAAVAVPVPENFNARILLRQSTTAVRQPTRWLALAAGMMLAVGLATGTWWIARPMPLEQLVFDHIDHEPQSLIIREDLRLALVNESLHNLGASVKPAIGRVDYLGICKIRKEKGGHLVIDGAKGPVTILLIPGEYVANRVSVRNERFHGVILPAHAGSLAIVGEHGENLDILEQRIRETVTF
ncbi:MAG: DUF3379 domain-containing protein [Sulfuricaulis sp.]|nr:DUF3379 domain-containing protein [Sulfuricaulis sp.]